MKDLLEQMSRRVLRHANPKSLDTGIPRLAIGAFRQPEPTMTAIGAGVCLILQGAKQMMVNRKMLRYSAGACFASLIELPTTCCVFEMDGDKPYVGTGLTLDHDLFTSLIADMPAAPQKGELPAFNIGTVSREVLEAWDHLLALLDAPDDIPILAASRERELIYRLLQSPHGPLLRQIAREEGRLTQIRRAIDWMRNHYDESFPIKTVADIAGMSVPSFNRHFRATTSMSPLQYHKTLRLQAARRLLASDVDATRTAYAVGYESTSQFSREYSRLFGHPPKRDASRLRGDLVDVSRIVV
ncbi:AraC family transcriptional regulator [Herbaspirillum sp. WKF16]|jgi:AraC-like DNA-binding protein|uniref:AraC family transcriptional regulator n=1 Tax=Herbaspirillum sp. WKF16 TaxID=3028312 RepID=UPI0023A933A7|nr:AraC family transcriptional regulator [Herbaspirillum sp. WKF16]WDZ95793.1 AraC family transcriptional regulator [Herbaspirillum sp. WKF16]